MPNGVCMTICQAVDTTLCNLKQKFMLNLSDMLFHHKYDACRSFTDERTKTMTAHHKVAVRPFSYQQLECICSLDLLAVYNIYKGSFKLKQHAVLAGSYRSAEPPQARHLVGA